MYRNNVMHGWAIAAVASCALMTTGCSSHGTVAEAASSNLAADRNMPPPREVLGPVTAPEGTALRVRTTSTVSTRVNHVGETVRASLEDPLVMDGIVLAPRGSDVTLMVADSNKGGRVKGRAHLALRMVAINASGENKSIRTNTLWYQARGTKKKDLAKIGASSGVGAGIGAIAGGGVGAAIGAGAGAGAGGVWVLTTRGDPAVVPAESVLQFRLTEPLILNVRS
jgi:hypothetical protein